MFEGEDIIAAFKCGHIFCVECANTALSYQPRCSVCRMAINCFSRLLWKSE
ncbi:hypothetical protein K2W90_00605 [Candidatus Babeliales bacterium]|nr:hypothetical protein [Candidatus Babeliales bacterium]